MGQRIPTRANPSVDEVQSYVLDMVAMLARLADDADLHDLADRLRKVTPQRPPSRYTEGLWIDPR
jgi:hypothetical protein